MEFPEHREPVKGKEGRKESGMEAEILAPGRKRQGDHVFHSEI